MPRKLSIVQVRLDGVLASLAVTAVTIEASRTPPGGADPDLTYSIVTLDFKPVDVPFFSVASRITDDRLVLLTNGQEQLKAKALVFDPTTRRLTVQPTSLI